MLSIGQLCDHFQEIACKILMNYSEFMDFFNLVPKSVTRSELNEFLHMTEIKEKLTFIKSREFILIEIVNNQLEQFNDAQKDLNNKFVKSIWEHAYNMNKAAKSNQKDEYLNKLTGITSMPPPTRKVIKEKIESLGHLMDIEKSKAITYLNHTFNLPWDKQEEAIWDILYSKHKLNETHYGLSNTKERILEFIAKNKRINNQKGLILLLVGPTGVGKTTIAKSVAASLKRKSFTVSMAGQKDVHSIKGFKHVYIGSEPGVFIKQLEKVKTKNPVIIIDEIDKIERYSYNGSVSSALLELLNVEQNNEFTDSYLDYPFDFSNAIFICTANSKDNILKPLLDRIEVINIDPYLPHEKLLIAQEYLIPSLLTEYKFNKSTVSFTNSSLMKIINDYCKHETGVRNLRKAIDEILRKITVLIEKRNSQSSKPMQINTINLSQLISKKDEELLPVYDSMSTLPVGTCQAISYVNEGQGNKLNLGFITSNFKSQPGLIITGNLGNVMKESVSLAVQVAKRVLNEKFNNKFTDDIEKRSYIFHCSQGDIKKEGPSAGCAIFSSFISLMLNKPIPTNLSMTGEISALGEVMKIGGVREKLTACKTFNINNVILPMGNKEEVESLNEELKEGFTIHYAQNVSDLYNILFEDIIKPMEEVKYKTNSVPGVEVIVENNGLDELL